MPVDDLRQSRELALLICKSEASIDTFLAHCDVAANDLLIPFGDVVTCCLPCRASRAHWTAPTVGKKKGGPGRRAGGDGEESYRRADWRKRELVASVSRRV